MTKSGEELGLRLRQQEAVARLGQLALSDVSQQILLDEACQVVGAELRADVAGVLELLADGSAFVWRAAFGWSPEQMGRERVPAGPSSHSGYTLDSSAPVIMRDARLETRFEVSQQMVAQGIVSGLSARIGLNDGPYGILGAHTASRATALAVQPLELEPPTRLVVSWGHAGSDALPSGASTVEITLIREDNGTTVRVAHSDLPELEQLQHALGWPHFLERLVVAGAGRDPGPTPGAPVADRQRSVRPRLVSIQLTNEFD